MFTSPDISYDRVTRWYKVFDATGACIAYAWTIPAGNAVLAQATEGE